MAVLNGYPKPPKNNIFSSTPMGMDDNRAPGGYNTLVYTVYTNNVKKVEGVPARKHPPDGGTR